MRASNDETPRGALTSWTQIEGVSERAAVKRGLVVSKLAKPETKLFWYFDSIRISIRSEQLP
jgi:hypothetical protein